MGLKHLKRGEFRSKANTTVDAAWLRPSQEWAEVIGIVVRVIKET